MRQPNGVGFGFGTGLSDKKLGRTVGLEVHFLASFNGFCWSFVVVVVVVVVDVVVVVVVVGAGVVPNKKQGLGIPRGPLLQKPFGSELYTELMIGDEDGDSIRIIFPTDKLYHFQ